MADRVGLSDRSDQTPDPWENKVRFRKLTVAARRVVDEDERYGKVLQSGTVAEEREAQKRVWDAIKELRKVLSAKS